MNGQLNYQTSKEDHRRDINGRSEHRFLFDMEEKYIKEVVIPKLKSMDSQEIKDTIIKQIKNKRGDWEIIGFIDNDLENERSYSYGMYYEYFENYQFVQDRGIPLSENPRYQRTDKELRLMEILDGMTQKEYNVYIKKFKYNDDVDTRGIEESLLKEVK